MKSVNSDTESDSDVFDCLNSDEMNNPVNLAHSTPIRNKQSNLVSTFKDSYSATPPEFHDTRPSIKRKHDVFIQNSQTPRKPMLAIDRIKHEEGKSYLLLFNSQSLILAYTFARYSSPPNKSMALYQKKCVLTDTPEKNDNHFSNLYFTPPHIKSLQSYSPICQNFKETSKIIKNPWSKNMTERLSKPLISPGLFDMPTPGTVKNSGQWTFEEQHELYPANILKDLSEMPLQEDSCGLSDKNQTKQNQTQCRMFFSRDNIVPSPRIIMKNVKNDAINTDITLPVDFDLESILAQYVMDNHKVGNVDTLNDDMDDLHLNCDKIEPDLTSQSFSIILKSNDRCDNMGIDEKISFNEKLLDSFQVSPFPQESEK
ncbi:hypothetical protein A3Q56_05175 [Intoshia linei]|uniref:Protein aurora borealis n=1 Tax=Intoshia linei TaxID=1819745 RepID=A0A177AYK3_9BILA|nr:hypothetical protein A3Q56_05175 [Intoshia linei]